MEAIPQQLSLSLSALKISESDTKSYCHISVLPPKSGSRKPCCCICIIDVSGSMGETGSIDKLGEVDGFSRLDLVKHAVRTVISMMTHEDMLSVITFASTANELIPLQSMTDANKKACSSTVDLMKADGGTNLWCGLHQGIETAVKNSKRASMQTSLWLFTDGESNENPTRGIMPEFADYMKDIKKDFAINMFGFGYKLDSKLLHDISVIGDGIFCYLPDANLVGTTFVNCLANSLSTCVNKAYLQISAEGVSKLKQIGGCNTTPKHKKPLKRTAKPKKPAKIPKLTSLLIEVGSVQYDQPRDFVLEFNQTCPSFNISAKLVYNTQEFKKYIDTMKAADRSSSLNHIIRCQYIDIVNSGLEERVSGGTDNSFIEEAKKLIMTSENKNEPAMKALLQDLVEEAEKNGRVNKAFSTPERVDKWGKHYVRSLMRAHQTQQCHNFLDPGVQVYGGAPFKQFQHEGDMTFCSLPPPTASLPKYVAPTASAPAAAPVMQDYMSGCGGGGGCFGGDCEILLADGNKKVLVRDIKKGDKVKTENGGTATVLCVVAFPMFRAAPMTCINGLVISPRHPIKSEDGVWVHPKTVQAPTLVYCDYIYNFVLDAGHTVFVNGTECVTLGHDKKGNSVISHEYYGSQRVICDLKEKLGWNEGKVILKNFRKIKEDGKVVKIV